MKRKMLRTAVFAGLVLATWLVKTAAPMGAEYNCCGKTNCGEVNRAMACDGDGNCSSNPEGWPTCCLSACYSPGSN